jgi:histone arginine demethylase JMJD6
MRERAAARAPPADAGAKKAAKKAAKAEAARDEAERAARKASKKAAKREAKQAAAALAERPSPPPAPPAPPAPPPPPPPQAPASKRAARKAKAAAKVAAAAAADAELERLPAEEQRRLGAKAVRAAKREARSELSVRGGGWTRRGYTTRPELLSTAGLADTVPRVDARSLTPAQFAARYEATRTPVVLTHCTDAWRAASRGAWEPAALAARFRHARFKVGSDDDGYAVRLRCQAFLEYLDDAVAGAAADDSPLYIFDGGFADRRATKCAARRAAAVR